MSESALRNSAEEHFRKAPLLDDKIGHTIAVAQTSEKIAKRMKSMGIDVDPELAYIGALLHEIGLPQSPYGQTEKEEGEHPWPEHAVVGAQMARDAGFPEPVQAAIQSHSGSFNKNEWEELDLPPAIVGDSWHSNNIVAKVVAIADTIVVSLRHHDPPLDPWNAETFNKIKDEGAFEEIEKIYRQRIGKTITRDHPLVQRVISEGRTLLDEMIKYVKAEDVPPAWPGLTTMG